MNQSQNQNRAKRFARPTAFSLAALAVLTMPALAQHAHEPIPGFEYAPPGFIPPPVNPAGATLSRVALGEGVYAIVSDRPPVDSAGFVVGDDSVLVIDAHLNERMAGQILTLVREVTDKPIAYLVHTNFHGDHTFGNTAFPESTTIVAHAKTAHGMADFASEYIVMHSAVRGDKAVLPTRAPRLPTLTFETSLTIDLGGRTVQLHHFGPANTPGDTIVYEPETRTAWTGNFILGKKLVPLMLDVGAGPYLEALSAFARELDVKTIVPGHAPPTDASVTGEWLAYLNEMLVTVRQAIADGDTLDQLLEAYTLNDKWIPGADTPFAPIRPVMQGFHRLNIAQTYREESARLTGLAQTD